MGLSAKRKQRGSTQAAAFDDRRLKRLHEIIEANSLLRGDFTLSSGRKSNYLFQLRQTTLHSEGALLIAGLIVDFMRSHRLTCIGGMVVGAVPIVAAVAPVSFQQGYPVKAFFVRKQAKAHGAEERIDGYLVAEADVLVVDDVTTTGASMLEAIAAMKEGGYRGTVRKALSIVDREEGARENLAAQGIELSSFFTRSDFGL
jgi:orotate phosphoribosyltransferase